MCGRYTFQNNKTIKEKHNIEVTPNYNVCPSTKVPVLSSQLNFMHWGYTPNWAKTPMNIINARYETIKDKPMFKTMKRCIMIMDGWYEWSRQFNWKRRENKKTPYYHHIDGNLIYMGALFVDDQCICVTKSSSGNIAKIHSRQPLLLNEDQLSDWLGGDYVVTDKVSKDIKIYEVSSYMNSPANNDINCIKSLEI